MLSAKQGQKTNKDEYPFWDNPQRWPHDPPGYVFLVRACHEIGRAIFDAQWLESWEEPDEPPDDCDLVTWEDYERKCDEFQKAFIAMRAKVVLSIAEHCEAGTLAAAVRAKTGARMIELEQHIWNLERVEHRFYRCEMSLVSPFAAGAGVLKPYWIYIQRARSINS
jgi:hypothetical protein